MYRILGVKRISRDITVDSNRVKACIFEESSDAN